MSIISWTSPRASEVILPTSTLTSVARSSWCRARTSPSRRTSAPRNGAGVSRQVRNAACARVTAASTSAAAAQLTPATGSPLTGEVTVRGPASCRGLTPQRPAASRARLVSSACVGRVVGGVIGGVMSVSSSDDSLLWPRPGGGEPPRVQAGDVGERLALKVQIADDLTKRRAHQEPVAGKAGRVDEPVDAVGDADEPVVVRGHLVQSRPAGGDAHRGQGRGAPLDGRAQPGQPGVVAAQLEAGRFVRVR